MTNQEKKIYNFCGKHADWWPSPSQVKEMVVLLQKNWVELTKGEIESWDLPVAPTVAEFAWFVEAKLKEKNL